MHCLSHPVKKETMPTETADPLQSSTRRKTRSTEEQIADLEALLERKKAKVAAKSFSTDRAGKKVLAALRALAWIAKHPKETEEPIAAACTSALDSLANRISKATGIPRSELPGPSSKDLEPELPFTVQ